MTQNRIPTLAFLLAGSSALLFVSSLSFLTLLLTHGTFAGNYGGTYVVVPLWLPVAFLVFSALVLGGSVIMRPNTKHQGLATRRLASTAILLTIIAWAICGVSWAVIGQ